MSIVSAERAVETGSDAAITDSARYLTFTLNGEAYALNIFHVTEILEHRQLTVVPMMPAFVRGVINLRGRAVPVIDLAIRFARGSTTIGRRTSVIIVHIDEPAELLSDAAADGAAAAGGPAVGGPAVGGPAVGGPAVGGPAPAGLEEVAGGGQDIGILVDAVNKVEAFADQDLEPPPAFGAGIRADYISGMARRDNDFIIVLNIGHILSLSELTLPGDRAAELAPAAGDHGASDDGARNAKVR